MGTRIEQLKFNMRDWFLPLLALALLSALVHQHSARGGVTPPLRQAYEQRIKTICDAKSGIFWDSAEEDYCLEIGQKYLEEFTPKPTARYEAGLALSLCLSNDGNLLKYLDRYECLRKVAATSPHPLIRQLKETCEKLPSSEMDDHMSCYSNGLARLRYL